MTNADVQRLTEKLHRDRLVHSCLTCKYFREREEVCALYAQRPPARVIAYGCPSWDDLPMDKPLP